MDLGSRGRVTPPPRTRPTLGLLRHGATAYSLAQLYLGWLDLPLARQGREQLSQFPRPEGWTSVWTSDLRRAQETAELLGLPAQVSPQLREFDFGSLEGRGWSQLTAKEQQDLVDWREDFRPGGESLAQFQRRVRGFCQSLGSGRHLLVCHGGVVMAIQSWLGLPLQPPRPGQLLTLKSG